MSKLKHKTNCKKQTKGVETTSQINLRYKILAFILALLMILGLFSSLPLFALNETEAKGAKQIDEAALKKAKAKLKDEVAKLPYTKEELIYVSLDPNNKADSKCLTPTVYVVNYFEAKQDCTVTDFGNYAEVHNLQPSKEWNVSKENDQSKIEFKLKKGEFFYYQGQLNDIALPWQIAYQYTLDGKVLSPAEIAHKDGHFKLEMSIKPNLKADTSFYDSYILQLQFALPLANFSNIKAKDAQISIAANKTNVVFMQLPKQTKTYVIEADAKDINLPSSNLTALPITFDLEADGLLGKQMGQLKALENGIGQLNSASNQLNNGYSKLSNGICELNIGSQKLANGGIELGDGAIKFSSGLQQYQAGLQQYLAGVGQLNSGMQEVKAGLSKAELQSYMSLLQDLQKYLTELPEGKEISLEELETKLDILTDTLEKFLTLLKQNQDLLSKILSLKVPPLDVAQMEKALNGITETVNELANMVDKLPDILALPNRNGVTPKPNSASKPAVTPSAKSAETPDGKLAVKPDTTPSVNAVTPDVKPSVAPDEKPSAATDTKPSVTPAETPDGKLAVKPDITPSVEPDAKPSAMPDTQPAAKRDMAPSVTPNVQAEATPNGNSAITNEAKSATSEAKAVMSNTAFTPTSFATPKKQTFVATSLSSLGPKPNPPFSLHDLKAKLHNLATELNKLQAQMKEISSFVEAIKKLKASLPDKALNVEELITKLNTTIEQLKKAKELIHKLRAEKNDAKLPGAKEIAEILDNIPKLIDGLNQLADGSSKLALNGAILSEKGGELVAGANQLTGGILMYVDGTFKLSKGVSKLADGAIKLEQGFQAFQAGFNKLSQATNGMSETAKQKMTQMINDLLGQNFSAHSFISDKNQKHTISQFVFIFPGTSASENAKTPEPSQQAESSSSNANVAPNKDSSLWQKLKALFKPASND